jgi:hypothetical protein
MKKNKAAARARAAEQAREADIAQSGVDESLCDYGLFGTSKRNAFIFSVR